MPLYAYRCEKCKRETEEYQHIREEPLRECSACSDTSSYHRIPVLTHTNMREFNKPIELHSIGLAHADEIQDFRKRNPEIDISSDVNNPLYGVPIARTRKQKLDVLKREGYIELK